MATELHFQLVPLVGVVHMRLVRLINASILSTSDAGGYNIQATSMANGCIYFNGYLTGILLGERGFLYSFRDMLSFTMLPFYYSFTVQNVRGQRSQWGRYVVVQDGPCYVSWHYEHFPVYIEPSAPLLSFTSQRGDPLSFILPQKE